MRNQKEKHKQNIEVKKRLRKETVYIPKTKKMAQIQNIPLDNNGYPDRDKADVQSFGKVFKGFHTIWQAILFDDRGLAYLRVVIA